MIIRIVADCIAWGVAAWLAISLRFGPGEQGEYLDAHLGGFLILGIFWVACRGIAYWAAAKLGRRWISVLLTALCPLATLAFCGAVSYVLFRLMLGRGLFAIQLLFAGWLWGLSSEVFFNPTRRSTLANHQVDASSSSRADAST